MKKIINIYRKNVEIPFRMFKQKDLESMELAYVENGVYLNLTKAGQRFPEVSQDIVDKMIIINYHDFSKTIFSEQTLIESCEDQIDSNSSFVILSKFKSESQYDIIKKLEIAGNIKKITNKPIIIEISYSSDVDSTIFESAKENFDFLSIFYGVHYGHLTQFEKIVTRAVQVKLLSGKRVLLMAVPMKYAGGSIHNPYYMPCYDLICDGWSKNWKQGGSAEEIKLTDINDLRYKNYIQWLETGYKSFDLIRIMEKTVYEAFYNVPQSKRDEYHQLLADEILSEIRRLTPFNAQDYITKFHPSFWGFITWAYNEKIIFEMFKQESIFKQFKPDENSKLEYAIREQKQPAKIYAYIIGIIRLITEENIISVPNILKIMKDREENKYS